MTNTLGRGRDLTLSLYILQTIFIYSVTYGQQQTAQFFHINLNFF